MGGFILYIGLSQVFPGIFYVSFVLIYMSLVGLFGLAFTLLQHQAANKAAAKAELNNTLDQARKREREELARTWRFELAEVPYPDPSKFVLGKYLIRNPVARKRLLLEAVSSGPEVSVQLRFRAHGIRNSRPIEHQVGSARLFQSPLQAAPSVSFPEALVNGIGEIADYGKTAIIYGLDLGLPEWQDEISQMDEEPWLWQIPYGKR